MNINQNDATAGMENYRQPSAHRQIGLFRKSLKHICPILCTWIILIPLSMQAAEYHVSKLGGDGNYGAQARPFKTISKAAEVAQPGDIITVHEGI